MSNALVVIDVQTCFTHPADNFDPAAQDSDLVDFFARVDDVVIPNTQALLKSFRKRGEPVYFTEMGSLRKDGSDLPAALRDANEKSIAMTGNPVIPPLDNDSSRTDQRIAPAEGEIVFRKTTTGTLASTPLAQNLRALGCTSVAVTGIVTDCCVAQTSRELADQDFAVTVIEDACASYVDSHHQAILEIFANFYGEVAATADYIAGL